MSGAALLRSIGLVLAASVALGASCEVGLVGVTIGHRGLSVTAVDGRLRLRNDSGTPIHYVAVEQRTAALVDLHFDPRTWPRLDPGERRSIRYEALMGWEPGATHAIIFWWTDGRYRDTLVVRLL